MWARHHDGMRCWSREIRGHVHQTARELEKSLARLTDNQDVVKGIRAFVRLVSNVSRS